MAGPARELSTSEQHVTCSWASSAKADEIGHPQQRIGDRFDHDQSRASGVMASSMAARWLVSTTVLLTAAGGRLVDQQCMAAAIEPTADDQMIAGSGLRDQSQCQGSHAAGGDGGPLGGVELAAFVGQQIGVGMPVAAIDVARQFAGQQGRGLLGTFGSDRRSTIGSAARAARRRQRRRAWRAGTKIVDRFAIAGFRRGAGDRVSGASCVHSITPGVRVSCGIGSVTHAAGRLCWHAWRPPSSAPDHGRFQRLTPVLGLFSAVTLVVGEVIGSGIFLKPATVDRAIGGYVGLILALWVVCGLVNLCGALALAELVAMFPQEGGTYVFLREAYGRLWSFLWCWTEFWVIRTGAIAALAAYGAVLDGRQPHGIGWSIAPTHLAAAAQSGRHRPDRAAGRGQCRRHAVGWPGAKRDDDDQGRLRRVFGHASLGWHCGGNTVAWESPWPAAHRSEVCWCGSARRWPRSCGPTTAGAM